MSKSETNTEHTNLETEVQDALNNAAEATGSGPRLRTHKPQVPWSGLIHGLTGQFTYLKDTDLVAYLKRGMESFEFYKPNGMREIDLVQRIIDATWRVTRVTHLTGCLHLSGFSSASQKLSAQHPEASLRDIAPYAEADAYREDSNELGKLSRYETTLNRLLKSLHLELVGVVAARIKYEGATKFKPEESEGYKWYRDLLAVATRLVAARKELEKKSEIIEDPPNEPAESTTSEPKMVRKTRLHIIQPLTKITRESLQTASDWGLLNDMERTLFPERTAAYRQSLMNRDCQGVGALSRTRAAPKARRSLTNSPNFLGELNR
jgi:hypothetical protein